MRIMGELTYFEIITINRERERESNELVYSLMIID